ncbi:hypothetical protein O3M35_011542 [Rhynocoris fuscipes]|uniref:Neurotrophin-3 n=1 Tax=Rhynocoris fuscipes TaxID=488301 RepID=A0AAW1CX15_9HEMI
MSSEDISDEDNERNAALKDALQCTFVQQVFNGVYHNSDSNTLPLLEKEEKKHKGTFEDNIAKVLARRLDEKIKEIEIKSNKSKENSSKTIESGIQLIKSGKIITSNDLTNANISTDKAPQVLYKNTNLKAKIYEKRAHDVAVTPEWVNSKENTKYWKDNKRPRIINMKTVKSSHKGAIVCRVLNDE